MVESKEDKKESTDVGAERCNGAAELRICGNLLASLENSTQFWLAEKLAQAQEASSTSTSEQQQQLVRIALEARNRLRLAKKFNLKRLRIANGSDEALTTNELKLLRLYDSDELRKEANKATLQSGHGRLKKRNGGFDDLGGSTGGGTRLALDNFVPPHPDDFDADSY